MQQNVSGAGGTAGAANVELRMVQLVMEPRQIMSEGQVFVVVRNLNKHRLRLSSSRYRCSSKKKN